MVVREYVGGWVEPSESAMGLLFAPALDRRSVFGDVVIVVFLVFQALDGVLTYLGLTQFGPSIEANPLISSVLPVLGQAGAVASAKLFAAALGMLLHVRGVHRAVAALSAFYFAVAVLPWAALLLQAS